jgi:hypothetical protein
MKSLDLGLGMDRTSRAKLRANSGLDAMSERDVISFLARATARYLKLMQEPRRAVALARFQRLLSETLEKE